MQTIPNLTVYDYLPDASDSFPYAGIDTQGHQDEFLTLASNHRQFTFVVRFVYPRHGGRQAEAEAASRDLLDTAIATIEADVTLGGACDWASQPRGAGRRSWARTRCASLS